MNPFVSIYRRLSIFCIMILSTVAEAATVSGKAPVVPGIDTAQVTLSNLNYVYTANFDSSGGYAFPAVEPGLYALKAEVAGYNQTQTVSVDTTTTDAVSVPDLALDKSTAAADSYGYTWVQDQSYAGLPKTEIAANIVQPTQVTIMGKAYQMADLSYAQELFDTYGIVLSNEGETWTQEYAFRLYSVLQRIPQAAGTGYKYNTALAPTRWILTTDSINNDIDLPTGSAGGAIRVSEAAFTYAAPFVAEIDGVRGLYFSKRLHAALVRYVTGNGTDQAAVAKILTDRYGLAIDTTAHPLDYTQFTKESVTRFQSWFTHPEELIQIINSFEELPEGFAKIAGFKWLIRRQDGTVNPVYPEAPAIAWSSGYMEFMESAFSSFNTAYITRLILHEKAHYLYQFVLTPAFKKTWAELGGWQYAPDPLNPDYNATAGWQTTKTTEFVSAYAHDKNPNEDFAETVAYFVNDPDALKARSMEKYTFIRDTVMLSNSYVSIIRPDLTFTVLNLFPNYEYPGKITRITTQVTGEATADKIVKVEVEISPFSPNSNPVVALQGRMLGPVTPEAPVAPYIDLGLSPVENSRTLFRGSVTLTKFARSGYWTLPNITLRDSVGLERYESSLLYGWKCYINNPLQDIVPPQVQPGTSSLTIRNDTLAGHPVQIATLRFNVTENTGLTSYLARLSPPSAYSMQQWGPVNTDGGGERTVDFVIKDYARTGRYTVDQIVLKDYGLNLNYTYFNTHSPLVGNADGTTTVADEASPFLDIVTANPDTKGPELDVNRITVTATPTNLVTPDGETLVTIKYFVRDDISGYGNNSNFILRDPQGIEHFYWFYHRNTYTEYFDGDPTAWEEYTQQVLLPRGSVPGVWGLSQMVLTDKAGNGQPYSFTETVRFDPMSTAAADLNIIGDPVSKSYAVGDSVSLSITVAGGDNVTYEWFKDGISLLSGAGSKSAASLTGNGELLRAARSVSILGAGTAKLTIVNAGKDSAGTYYCIVSNSSGRVVSKAAVMSVMTAPTVTWATPTAITYGMALSAAQLNAMASVPGTFAYNPAIGAVLGAGSRTLSVTFAPSDTVNYSSAAQTQSLTVNKAPLTVTAANQARSYGAANPALTISYLGFVNSDSAGAITAPTASTSATTASAVGDYPITLTGGAAANYTLTLQNGTLTVTSVAPTVTWATPAAITYGTALSVAQLNATASVPGTFDYIPAAGTVLGAGSQTLSVTFTPSDTLNYGSAAQTQTLSVNKAPLTATAANQSRVYGAGNPALTVSYAGFVNNETAAVLASAPTASTTATTASLPGVYPVTLTGGSAANYTLTLQPGLLAVTPRDYSGAYFGMFASGGHWALNVHRDNTATYIAYLPSRHSAIVVNLTIDATGAFTVTGTEIKPLAGSSLTGLALNSPEAPVRRQSAAAGDFTVTGQITVSGALAGQLAGFGETLTGAADGATGSAPALAGFYTAAALNTASGATYTIVGPSGQAVVVSTTPSAVDGAAGMVDSNGQLTATTSNNALLTFSIDAQAQTLSASLTPAGSNTPITYAGLPDTVAPVARVVNLSVRSGAGSGSQTLIVGFVVTGTGNKNLLLRGMGPSLAPLGVVNALTDPVLRLHDSTGAEVANNDDWGGSAAMVNSFASVGAFVPAANSKDAALQQVVSSGPYTFHVIANGTAGVALAELYDADNVEGAAKVVNLSARTQVGTGENILIAGFVITGNAPKRMLIRGLGPTLLSYGVTGVLADPQLNVYSGGALAGSNDDWGGTAALKDAFATAGAGALVSDTSKDAALLVTLPPGVYSAQVSGANGTTGVGLVEIFLLP